MDPDTNFTIDTIADTLDDLKTATEELQNSPAAASLDAGTLEELKNALERASEAADKLENQNGT